jgi:5-methylthioadenosine/S-adenosylhomocysteine deaminase
MPIKLLVHNAALITMAEGWAEGAVGWFTVDAAGKIAALGYGEPDAVADVAQKFDAGGAFVAPGFVSAHSHLCTSGSRGMALDCTLYGWIEQTTRYLRHSNEQDIYWIVLHGALDFLSNGVTTAYDFCAMRQPFHMDDTGTRPVYGALKSAGYAEQQVRAKVDSGIRFINSIMLDDRIGTDEEIEARFEATLRYAEQLGHGGRYLGTAISGAVQFSDDRHTAEREAKIMRRFGVINQPHFLETAEQVEFHRAKFAWYEEAGALGPGLIFGHFVHPTHDMIRTAARYGCAMSWQPTSNGRLASGIADIPLCLAEGLRVGVGLDDQACTDISDPWLNMRMGIYTLRAMRTDPAAMGVGQMLRLHTLGSARALGISQQVGSLEPGKYADFLVVDPRHPDTGPVWDPIGTYVLACGLRNLKCVFVGGELVNREGSPLNPLAAQASAETHRRLKQIAAGVNAT